MLRFSILLMASTAFAQQYTISTVAGGAPPATPVPALNTSIGQPRKLAISGSNVYFSSGNSVFKIDGSGTLTLIAGNSRAGFSGDGGPAVNAQLNAPQGLALDAAGNLYIADSQNNRVRMVDTNGVITTFAGNGTVNPPGFWGDGGPAVNASLHLPTGVAVDSSGKVYIAAASDNTVRVVTTDGLINIFAGSGYPGYYGDYAATVSGNTTTVTNVGTATIATLFNPQDVAIGPNNSILIADAGNSAIRQVTSAGIIYTISGNGSTGLSGDGTAINLSMLAPFSVAADSSGNIYAAEFGTNRIRKLDTKGNITTAIGDGNQGFAGDGGPANKVEMNLPTGVAVDPSGNILFADSLNNRIRKLANGSVNTIAGNGVLSHSGDGGAATGAQLNTPLGVAVDAAGNTYIADTANNVVRRVDSKGVISNFAGTGTAGSSGDGSAATGAQLSGPQGLAVDSAGNLYIADTQNHRVRKVAGGTISTVAGSGTAGFAGDGAAAGGAQLNLPFGVAVDSAGNLYIAEFGNNRVRKVTAGGTINTIAGNGVFGYSGDGGQATGAMLNGPQGVAVDTLGNVYIADTANNRVRQVAPNGTIATVAGTGIAGFSDGGSAVKAQVGNPVAVAVDSTGNLFIADGSSRVRKVFVSGLIQSIAGNGTKGYTGDGGIATSATLSGPSALAVNSAGNVWVADTLNNAVRLLQFVSGGTTVNAVANGASNLSGPVAPGEVIVIYGSGLGPAQLAQYQLNSNGLVPSSVGGTSVYINGSPAPVLYSSANQVAAVVPFGISGSLAQLYVQNQNLTSAPFNLSVASQIPAIFTLGSGTGQAAVINNKDGSINGAGHPAKVGDYVQLYITGVGQTNPAGSDGLINAATLPVPVAPVTVTIGGLPAGVNFAGGAPGTVAGVFQLNAQIPAGVTAGSAVPVVVQVGTSNSQPNVTIAVTN
jgi:uncharacterized protein (TIGR03437 family)